MECRAVRGRHPQQLGDDHNRQRIRQVVNQIEAPTFLANAIQQLADDGDDPRPKLLDHARRERLLHERPESGVIGWV